MRAFLVLLALAFAAPAAAEPHAVLVTIDGLRWQEVFNGADPALVSTEEDRARYVDVADRAAALTPFLRSFATAGALIGDRGAGSCGKVENRYWFSYPGYAEMLGGRPNRHIRSNGKTPNGDTTVLEWLNRREDFAGRVAVFAEWDVVPFIVNAPRSGLPVFVAPQDGPGRDGPTMAAARAAYAADPPRVAWIDLGATDTRAHAGDYAGYLAAAAAADRFLAEFWAGLEAGPRTAGRTTLLVTTDHGRGESAEERWRGHGSGRYRRVWVPGIRREGSDAVWFAVRGPAVAVGTDVAKESGCAVSGQVAATLLQSLDVPWTDYRTEARPPLSVFR